MAGSADKIQGFSKDGSLSQGAAIALEQLRERILVDNPDRETVLQAVAASQQATEDSASALTASGQASAYSSEALATARLSVAPTDEQVAALARQAASQTRMTLFKNAGDIRGFGASVDAADNGPAIQAAMNSAAQNKHPVFVPDGIFTVAAKTGRTLTLPTSPISIIGQSRKNSVIRATATSDWAYLFAYSSSGACDGLTVRNLTIDGSQTTGMTKTGLDWSTARTLFNIIGANITIESCNLICNGVWVIKHVGANARLRDNNITIDMSRYTLGWFDHSAIWSNLHDGRIENNVFTTIPATTNPFTVQTAIEFQGHRNTVAGNKGTANTKFRNGIIFTANTNYAALDKFYPASAKGAVDNTIENNTFTVTRYGVEIWGMAVQDPQPIQGTRIRRNQITVDNTGSSQPGALVSMFIGTPGGAGNDGPQTSPVVDLKISDNLIRYMVRRVSTTYSSADAAVRLYTEMPMTGVKVTNNEVQNCGGFGVLGYVADHAASSVWIDGLDVVESNTFRDVREPIRLVRQVRNWSAVGNIFEQSQIYSTLGDNMLETIRQPGSSSTPNGTVLRNRVRTQAGHWPHYPTRDQGIAQSTYPASLGFVVEQMGCHLETPGLVVTIGAADMLKRVDNSFVKARYSAGATFGKLVATDGTSSVTIQSVIDTQTMTVSDATNLRPGQVLTIPYQAPFSSGSAVIVAVVGSTVRVAASQLAILSGHAASEANGATLSFYTSAVTVS